MTPLTGQQTPLVDLQTPLTPPPIGLQTPLNGSLFEIPKKKPNDITRLFDLH